MDRKVEKKLVEASKETDNKRLFCVSMLLGMIMYILIYGIANLNVTYDAFLINDGKDLPQHYLGSVFYRFAKWDGIGMFNTLTYPNSTTILFTDSTPIMALITKILSPVLPNVFQYCGIWGLICFMLQAGMAGLILSLATKDSFLILAGEIPFILATPMLTKLFYHHAFGGQFVILLGIYYWFLNYKKDIRVRKDSISWFLIGVLCILVNVYFLPMLGMIVMGYAISLFMYDRKNLFRAVSSIVTYIIGALTTFAAFGGFTSNFQSDPTYKDTYIDLLKRCGANLDTFINSYGIALIGPKWNFARDGQGEGFAYLGVGVFAVIIISLIYCRYRNQFFLFRSVNKELKVSVIIIFIMSMIVGVGPTLSWHEKYLAEILYPKLLIELWATFRSTGRFIWVAYYLVLIFSMCLFLSLGMKQNIKRILLVLVCIVQIIDLSPYLYSRHMAYAYYYELETEMVSDAWDYLGESYDHAVVLPNYIVNRSEKRYEVGKWAADNHITLNDFYLSRQKLEDQSDFYIPLLLKGDFEKDTVYIFNIDALQQVIHSDLHFYKIDNWYVGTVEDIGEKIGLIEIDKNSTNLLYLTYTKDNTDYSLVFDAMYYYYSYSDVQAAYTLNDVDGVFEHFINIGMTEGRQGTDSFDPKVYREFNGDLNDTFGDDWIQYYYHFINYGNKEERKCR